MNETILVLDSDPVMSAVLREALDAAGYLVISAHDLGAAVDRLDEVEPDLLIVRPYINSMPGFLAADYLRTKHPGLPVLVVAGFMNDDRVNVQNSIRQFHVFPESFEREQLLAIIKSILECESKKHSCNF
ncbi:MAG TPA: response regulator [Terriglobia bacterium]|nr:response regulator [Terriglobia bacterium]